MKHILTALVLSLLSLGVSAEEPLSGFLYGQVSAPDGTEWQSPEKLSLNKLQPRAHVSPLPMPMLPDAACPKAAATS